MLADLEIMKQSDTESQFRRILFVEGMKKREHNKQVIINQLMFDYAEDHQDWLSKQPFDDAVWRLSKKGMARQSGGSTLRNSGWNTDWNFKDPSPDIARIKEEVKRKALHFFRSLQGEGPFPRVSQLDLRPRGLSFVFAYIRTIMPDNNQEASQKATRAMDILDQYLPGFRQFQQEIERLNIPLNPYFMTSNFSNQNGRVNPDQLQQFLINEAGKPLQLPGGKTAPSGSHYKEHLKRLHEGDNVKVSDYPNVFRIFSMQDVDNIPNSSWLIQAIDDKIDAGYQLDLSRGGALQQYANVLLQQKLKENELSFQGATLEQKERIRIYQAHYGKLFQSIEDWWEDREQHDLPTFALRLILKSLKYTGGGTPEVRPDEFRIKKATTPYLSNGWDSSAEDANKRMLTLPPLRQLPDGEVVYDRGNGNMGYDHLVLNWKDGLERVLTKWGEQADVWLRQLQGGNAMRAIAEQSPEVFAAWQNILSLGSGNRTGAETLLTLFQKYPTWQEFDKNHLQKSLSSEIRTVNTLLKEGWDGQHRYMGGSLGNHIQKFTDQIERTAESDPVNASRLLKAVSAELCHYYRQGKLPWDYLTQALNSLNVSSLRNRYIKGNGIVSPRSSERRGMIDQNGFELLKRYGYQVAKIMDFLYAVMTRSCHEAVNTRWNGAAENFYGHQYSTSSGKSLGGDIILKVFYDQLDATTKKDGVDVTEKLQFTLGQSTGAHDPIILRSSLPWQQMVSAFGELYPEAGYQLSEINEPISRNLDMLEIAVKEALNEVRGNIQVTYRNTDGNVQILIGSEIASDKMDVREDAGDTALTEEAPAETPGTRTPQPTRTPSQPTTWFEEDMEPDLDVDLPSTQFTPREDTPTIPVEEKTMVKQMPEQPLEYLQKRRNDKRRLFRERPQNLGSIEDRLLKAANRLDEHGENTVANKIDLLLQKLCEVKYVREKSRI
ncbi:MAG: hypothetical protein ACXAC5_03265 [Promethearchaeota archaeon]|jgi:hypothetical protein